MQAVVQNTLIVCRQTIYPFDKYWAQHKQWLHARIRCS
jgi:hypothetical protein